MCADEVNDKDEGQVWGERARKRIYRGESEGGKAGLLIRKHDHFTPAREIRRDVRALQPATAPQDNLHRGHVPQLHLLLYYSPASDSTP